MRKRKYVEIAHSVIYDNVHSATLIQDALIKAGWKGENLGQDMSPYNDATIYWWDTEEEEETMGETRRFRLENHHIGVQYLGANSAALTTGCNYIASYDPTTKDMRVLNNQRKWSKYATSNFKPITDPFDGAHEFVHGEFAMLPSGKTLPSIMGILYKPLAPGAYSVPSSAFVGGGVAMSKVAVPLGTITEVPESIIADIEVKETKTMKEATPVKKNTLTSFLKSQGVNEELIEQVKQFRVDSALATDADDDIKSRIKKPEVWYVGEAWNVAISAILAGKNILLEGDKATGKNVFAECLSYIFGRPLWDISCHVNTNAESLIGGETFKNGQVEFRPGSIYNVAKFGGFGILDELNMAKASALAVLHSVTDRRRVLDVPGYERIALNEATRLIGTMNSGYVGTSELNEALVSRFVVIHVESMTEEALKKHLMGVYPDADTATMGYFVKLFMDLQTKAKNAEISTKSVDLRGIQDAIDLVKVGKVKPYKAVEACIINKVFDQYEKNIVKDLVNTLIPSGWTSNQLFPKAGSISVTF